MILKKITIHNYRSIEELSFDINQLDDETYTYGLIGVNEAGKSTILKAIALKDGLKDEKGQVLPLAIDFKDKNQLIEIEYLYFLDKEEINECKEHLKSQSPEADLSKINLSEINLIISFNHANPSQLESNIDIKKISEDNEEKTKIEEQLKQLVLQKSHKSIFWTAEDRYLISQPINLDQFAATPDDVSIPLKNCFLLAGINKEDIQAKISSLASDPAEIEELQNNLGEVVTKHIKRVWPKHPIEITFLITSGLIHFHVKDSKVKGRAKTANQRSDGFRQFISFLLTISAENEKKQLSNSILLLDEPETHLHPQAQEDLLQELIKITKNKSNNIAFFATHSNYMIDKKDLSRNYKIKKPEKTDVTGKEQFNKKISSYASVTYEVFEIDSMDYHNELYDKLREKYSDEINKDNIGILEFDNGFFVQKKKQETNYPYKTQKNKVTLSTFVRNAIHYPQNKDDKFSENLQKSIKLLKSYEN
jgi:predicted ATP-dependent endonuclease of OLD family